MNTEAIVSPPENLARPKDFNAEGAEAAKKTLRENKK